MRAICKMSLISLSFIVVTTLLPVLALGQTGSSPAHHPHAYSAYEKLVYRNVSQFHQNFNRRDWAQNGLLVADELKVHSNGTEVVGRDAFVKRIARFVTPFPDVKITDQTIIVDGNIATIRFVVTGTQTGDLETPTGLLHRTNRRVQIDGLEFFTFDKDGKLVDLVTVEDMASMFRQLTEKTPPPKP